MNTTPRPRPRPVNCPSFECRAEICTNENPCDLHGFRRAVTLTRVKLATSNVISKAMLEHVNLDTEVDFRTRDMILRLNSFVWGERIGTAEVAWPEDWWQALKLRFFPEWALRLLPVRWTRKVFEASAIYPDFRPSVPNEPFRFVASVRDAS